MGKWLVECAIECPLIAGVRSIKLDTRDAQGLYAQFGFKESRATGGDSRSRRADPVRKEERQLGLGHAQWKYGTG